MDCDQNMKYETIKCLKENIEEYLHDFELSKDFLKRTQKALTIMEETDRLVYIEL